MEITFFLLMIVKKNSLNQKIKSKIRSKMSNTAYDFLSSKKRQTERKIKLATAQTSLEKRSIDTRTAQKRYLFDDVTHIPFLMAGAKIPQRGIVSDMVRNVDIFPTIGELVDLPKSTQQINGRSLLRLLKGENMKEEPAYLENTILQQIQSHQFLVLVYELVITNIFVSIIISRKTSIFMI